MIHCHHQNHILYIHFFSDINTFLNTSNTFLYRHSPFLLEPSHINQLCSIILTYLLTPCVRVLVKLTGSQLIKKFPTFYGTINFITMFTRACHLSLSWARSIQPLYSTVFCLFSNSTIVLETKYCFFTCFNCM